VHRHGFLRLCERARARASVQARIKFNTEETTKVVRQCGISIWVSSFEIEKHAAYTDTSLADIAEASLGFLETPKRAHIATNRSSGSDQSGERDVVARIMRLVD